MSTQDLPHGGGTSSGGDAGPGPRPPRSLATSAPAPTGSRCSAALQGDVDAPDLDLPRRARHGVDAWHAGFGGLVYWSNSGSGHFSQRRALEGGWHAGSCSREDWIPHSSRLACKACRDPGDGLFALGMTLSRSSETGEAAESQNGSRASTGVRPRRLQQADGARTRRSAAQRPGNSRWVDLA